MAQTFVYDAQIKRFLLQFTRMVSNFQVEYGRDSNGNVTLLQVPVKYGDASRQAQSILQENSANNMPSAPLMTFYVSGLDYDRDRIQEPHHVSKMNVRQRKYDPDTDTYSTEQGNAFTVERPMPVPYKLSINLDLWTTNINQKLQLVEQMSPLFNPSMEIQSTDNFIDWTSLTVVELDRTNWSSRSIPVGTESPIDIFTYQFTIPIWLSPPARVKKLGVVNKIIASIYDAKGDAVSAITNSDLLLGTRMQLTPYGYQVLLLGNEMRVLRNSVTTTPGANLAGAYEPAEILDELGPLDDYLAAMTEDELGDLVDYLAAEISEAGNDTEDLGVDWKAVIEMYGVLRPGITVMRLFRDDLGIEVSGTVAYHPFDPKIMLFTIDEDTKPANTLAAVTAIINPATSGPGAGLPAAAPGQRYLLLGAVGAAINTSPAVAWGSVVAVEGDIIEYNGANWVVAFDSQTSVDIEFVTNITTGTQYIWSDNQWLKSFEGLYAGGQWTAVL